MMTFDKKSAALAISRLLCATTATAQTTQTKEKAPTSKVKPVKVNIKEEKKKGREPTPHPFIMIVLPKKANWLSE